MDSLNKAPTSPLAQHTTVFMAKALKQEASNCWYIRTRSRPYLKRVSQPRASILFVGMLDCLIFTQRHSSQVYAA